MLTLALVSVALSAAVATAEPPAATAAVAVPESMVIATANRKGAKRVGGTNSKGKNSKYVGGTKSAPKK